MIIYELDFGYFATSDSKFVDAAWTGVGGVGWDWALFVQSGRVIEPFVESIPSRWWPLLTLD